MSGILRNGLHTKLTGAGGGGCAFTLLPEDVMHSKVAALVETLSAQGFTCFETVAGGPGVLVHPPFLRTSEDLPTVHPQFQYRRSTDL